MQFDVVQLSQSFTICVVKLKERKKIDQEKILIEFQLTIVPHRLHTLRRKVCYAKYAIRTTRSEREEISFLVEILLSPQLVKLNTKETFPDRMNTFSFRF